jgi:hypothetical protein
MPGCFAEFTLSEANGLSMTREGHLTLNEVKGLGISQV